MFCKLEEFTNWLTRYAISTMNADDSAKNGESSVVGREFDQGKRPNIIIIVLSTNRMSVKLCPPKWLAHAMAVPLAVVRFE